MDRPVRTRVGAVPSPSTAIVLPSPSEKYYSEGQLVWTRRTANSQPLIGLSGRRAQAASDDRIERQALDDEREQRDPEGDLDQQLALRDVRRQR